LSERSERKTEGRLSDREDPRILIVGGGFGGLYAAKSLAKAKVRITLIDRKNHHTFQPLLYQVATAGLNPSDIAVPIRRILRRQGNVSVLLGEVTSVDTARKVVVVDRDELTYDYLILATGATHSYFGHPEWEELAPGLKSIEDALEMRRRIYFAYEAAERAASAAEREAWMTFVVVGAGPTGVELAGVLAEIAHHTLNGEFDNIDTKKARILLLEGGPRVLASYVPELSAKAEAQLRGLGVDVRTSTRVTKIDDEGVAIGDERIASKTVLWAAGVAASPLGKSLGVPLDRAGRVIVEPDLSIPGHPEVFVLGDLMALTIDGKPVPGVAPAAMQGARYAADAIARTMRGEARAPFRYVDKGSLATIGRAAAVADFGRFKLSGFVSWLAWFFIHIFFLIGFRNRFLVMFEWALSYLTYERGSRLITGDPKRLLGPVSARPRPPT
jgi:NADH dehydrogenase